MTDLPEADLDKSFAPFDDIRAWLTTGEDGNADVVMLGGLRIVDYLNEDGTRCTTYIATENLALREALASMDVAHTLASMDIIRHELND